MVIIIYDGKRGGEQHEEGGKHSCVKIEITSFEKCKITIKVSFIYHASYGM